MKREEFVRVRKGQRVRLRPQPTWTGIITDVFVPAGRDRAIEVSDIVADHGV